MTAVRWLFALAVAVLVWICLLIVFALFDLSGPGRLFDVDGRGAAYYSYHAIATTLGAPLIVILSSLSGAAAAPSHRQYAALALGLLSATPLVFYVLSPAYPYPVWLRLVDVLFLLFAIAIAFEIGKRPRNLAQLNCYYRRKSNQSRHETQCRDAFALNDAAVTQMGQSQYDSALQSFYQVLAAFRKLASNDEAWGEYRAAGYHLACEARTWGKIAEVQELKELDTVATLNSLQQGLAVLKSVEPMQAHRRAPRLDFREVRALREDRANMLKAIGDVLKSRGEYASALESYQQALRERASNAEGVKNSIARVKALLASPGTTSRV